MSQNPTIYSVTRRVMTELGNNIPVQMDEDLMLLDPNENPFTLITTRLGKRKVGDDTYNWDDDEIVPEHSQLSGASAAIAAAATGTWNVDDGTRFAPWDIVKNMNTGSWGQVTAVSTNALTVDAHVAILAGSTDDVIVRLGNSMEEGGGVTKAKSTAHTRRTNYIQRITDAIRFTRPAMKADDYWGGFGADYKRQHRKKLIEHARNIEWAFLFNGAPTQAAPDTSITDPADLANNLGITMGFEYFLTTYAPSDNVKLETDLTRSEFYSWLEPCFQYGSDHKFLFAAPSLFAAFLEWGLGQVRFKASSEKQVQGLNFAEISLPFGPSRITLINHRMLRCPVRASGQPVAYDYAFLVDMADDKVKYVYFNGLDTTVQRDVVKDGSHVQVDEVSTYCGSQFRLAETHGMLRWKTYSA